MHQGSKETYEFIADWIDPKFFFSRNDVWHRMGILGVFGDYVLSCTQGQIVEVGTGESSIYLSHLARKYHRSIYHCDIAPDKILNPLTIPGYMLEGVVPELEENLKSFEWKNSFFYFGASDNFFNEMNPTNLALSFIDGDHNYKQAKKDFDNLMARTVTNGYVMLHDTYPPDEFHLNDYRCGDVYKLRQEIEEDRNKYDCITLVQGTAMGVGITIARKKPAALPYWQQSTDDVLMEG